MAHHKVAQAAYGSDFLRGILGYIYAGGASGCRKWAAQRGHAEF